MEGLLSTGPTPSSLFRGLGDNLVNIGQVVPKVAKSSHKYFSTILLFLLFYFSSFQLFYFSTFLLFFTFSTFLSSNFSIFQLSYF